MQISGNISANGYISGIVHCNGSSAGTDDYNNLKNKPSLNGAVLVGDISFADIGIYALSEIEIDSIIDERNDLI